MKILFVVYDNALRAGLGLLFCLFALSGHAVTPDVTARLLAGLPTESAAPPAFQGQTYAGYVRDVSLDWDAYQQHIGGPMEIWAQSELPAAPGGAVFYPFSGPDLPTAVGLYPLASRYVLIAMQPAGAPPDLASYSSLEVAALLKLYGRAWHKFSQLGFFLTNDLDRDTAPSKVGITVTSTLMAFAVRLGYRIDEIFPLQLNVDGSDVLPSTSGDWSSVRLVLARNGERVFLDYLSMDLSDAHLNKAPAEKQFVTAMSRHPSLLKAASHLPQSPAFSVIRQAITENAPSLFQDETGIDYGLLAKTWETSLYGSFTRANHLFKAGAQTALAAAYRNNPKVKALPFRVGYNKDSGYAVQVAYHRNAVPGALVSRTVPAQGQSTVAQDRGAQRGAVAASGQGVDRRVDKGLEQAVQAGLAEYQNMERKYFIGANESREPFADYLREVRGILADRLSAASRLAGKGQGMAVTLRIAQDGRIMGVDVDRSSRDTAVDRQVLAMLQTGKVPPLPAGIRGSIDVLGVTFRLPER